MKMNKVFLARGVLWICGLLLLSAGRLHAQDSFGSGENTFTLHFVTVGNAGNSNDAGAGGGSYSSPYGGVGYDYRISTCAIRQSDIEKASASGLSNVTAGAHTGNEPAAFINWYEAAAFVNWMNTSKGYPAAYNLTYSSGWSMAPWPPADQAATGVRTGTNAYRHKDAFYFLPGEDEWYKAAYHQNDGVTANYWDYATGSNTIPTAVSSGTASGTVVYEQSLATGPADVDTAGGLSPYGTMGQNGNIWEWMESAADGVNDATNKNRCYRGGEWRSQDFHIRSSLRNDYNPATKNADIGFRVASIPEPSGLPSPHFQVYPESDGISGDWSWITSPWLPNASITITIGDPANPNHVESVMTDGNGYWTTGDMEYDIQAGDGITVSDGVTTLSHEVRDLGVEGADASTDQVWGWSAANTWVSVWIDNTGVFRSVQADGDGRWNVDFSVPVGDGQNENRAFDLQAEDTGWASQYHTGLEPPGTLSAPFGSTTVDWRVAQPMFDVHPWPNGVSGNGWPSGQQVSIFIGYDLLNPAFSETVIVEGDGFWWLGVDAKSFNIVPGMWVRAQCGDITKDHEVQDLGVLQVDAAADTVRGTASPGAEITVYIYSHNIWRTVLTDANGEWLANFAVAVGDEPGDQSVDIVEGTEGDVGFRDTDGDTTRIAWRCSNAEPTVFLGLIEVEGEGSEPYSEFSLEVNGGSILSLRFRTPLDEWYDLASEDWHRELWEFYADEPTFAALDARFPAGEYLVEITKSSGVSFATLVLPESLERPNATPNILTPLDGAEGVAWPDVSLQWAAAMNPNFNLIGVEIQDEVGAYNIDAYFGNNTLNSFWVPELEPDTFYQTCVIFANYVEGSETAEGIPFALLRARMRFSSFSTAVQPPEEMQARIDWYVGNEVPLDPGDTWSKAENRDRFEKGLTLRQEYVADTLPNDPDSTFRVNSLSLTNPISVSFEPNSAQRVYTLQYRTSLTEGDWEDIETQTRVPGGAPLEAPVPEGTGFYRVIVELP